MGMVIDNPDTMFAGLSKKERLESVLAQFVDKDRLEFCTDNVWQLISSNYCVDEAPLPNSNAKIILEDIIEEQIEHGIIRTGNVYNLRNLKKCMLFACEKALELATENAKIDPVFAKIDGINFIDVYTLNKQSIRNVINLIE